MNSLLLIDFYKAVHRDQIPQNMTKSVSYFTPRMSRVKMWDEVVFFGLQMFITDYLMIHFHENFFSRQKNLVISEYEYLMNSCLGAGVVDCEPIGKLHDLGYLPIEIVALPEGMKVPMGCPCFGITNTHPDFAWLPQALESLISAELWYPMICATVGHTYRRIVNRYYELTCDDNIDRSRALGNFDFRGDQGLDAALKAASGWLLSFRNTATVPAIPFVSEHFNTPITEVGFGAVSTEHFVMCSNYAIDGDEKTFIKRMLTELYPNTSFSCVCDSYDYWNVVENILPELKEEILAHNGCMLVRGDSGDCVEVVTKTVFKLWDIFGGTVNSKGYKVLDPHVKAIYGDSITIERCEKIYEILKKNGFAASNVALGVGSFSMHCIEEEGILKPFSRDTFGCAIKATYAEFTNEDGTVEKKGIFKDPKTDRETGHGFKKSQKGCCEVFWANKLDKKITYMDGLTWDEACENNLMKTVFKDGEYVGAPHTLKEIRDRLNNNRF